MSNFCNSHFADEETDMFYHYDILISAMIEPRVRVCNSILGGHENFPEELLLDFSLSERAINHS